MKPELLPEKLRGGYYTPARLARWLCDWAIRSADDRILEPSCGDGAFLEAAESRLGACGQRSQPSRLVGIELSPGEVEKARRRVARASAVVAGDFFQWLDGVEPGAFDVAVGNPPFLRFQSFPEPARSRAMDLMESLGLRPNRLTNAWVPFVIGATRLLAPGGRLAMVLPAELLQVSYAAQLRGFLADSFRRLTIFTCNEMFFERAEQEVLLLAAEDRVAGSAKEKRCDIALYQADGLVELLGSPLGTQRRPEKAKRVEHDTEKWLKYFLDGAQIGFMRSLRSAATVAALSEHAEVDVGVVTGRNEFFLLSEAEVRDFDLSGFVVPLVGRSAHLRGAVFRTGEHRSLGAEGKRVFLLDVGRRAEADYSQGLREWIRRGERRGFHRGYKCRIRSPWYRVPSVWIPDCFFLRQIYDFPRAIWNRSPATSTDTIHRMRCKKAASKIAAHLYTHLSAASAEIEGRSYGGGVLELEPVEAERLLLPRQIDGAMPITEADRLVRRGRLAEVLEHNDRAVLQGSVGLSRAECRMLRDIWGRMRDRRLARRRRPRTGSGAATAAL